MALSTRPSVRAGERNLLCGHGWSSSSSMYIDEATAYTGKHALRTKLTTEPCPPLEILYCLSSAVDTQGVTAVDEAYRKECKQPCTSSGTAGE
eukprot:scaffold65567_cov31-Prasinocladus_malaysianus.AAC.2